MNTMPHCPDCGATTRKDRDDDGWVYAVCMNDDCDRVVVEVLSRPSQRRAAQVVATPMVQVNVRVPPELHKQLTAQARKQGTTVTAVVATAIRQHLNGSKGEGQ
jgi:hypothetical protein